LTSDARVARVTTMFALPPALVGGVVAGILGGVVAAVIVFVVLVVALAAWARLAGERAVQRGLSRLGAHPADPIADARVCNLVDGLSAVAGLVPPKVMIVDTEGLNALASGRRSGSGVLAVTSALLGELELIELEAVLAEALVQIRRGDTVPATMVVATFGVGRRMVAPAQRDALADQAGVRLTRYPPALAAALEKIEAKGAEVPDAPAYMSHLWLADPGAGVQHDPARLPLRERIEALREL
jgi:Zn-dependent protease with chaperone function